jgi:O-antigen/teichoic acid export membrane protein
MSRIYDFFRAKHKAILYIVSFGLVFALEFVIGIYLSKKVNTGDFLFYTNVISFLPLLAVIANFGTSYSLVYIVSLSKIRSKQYLNDANRLSIKIFCILCPLLLLGTIWFKIVFLIIGLIIGLVNAIKQNVNSYYLAILRADLSSYSRIISKAVIFLLVLVAVPYKLFNFSWLYCVIEVISLATLVVIYKVPFFNKSIFEQRLIKFSKYAFLSSILNLASLSMPLAILNFLKFSKVDTINFSLGYQFFRYMGVMLGPFMQMAGPQITRNKNNKVQLRKSVKALAIKSVLFSICIGVLMKFFVEFVVVRFYAPRYKNMEEYFDIFLLGLPFLFLAVIFVNYTTSLGYIKFNVLIELVLFIFGGVISLVLVKNFGAIAGVWSILLLYFLKAVTSYIFLNKKLSLK